MATPIFRKSALEKLTSPEQLDQAITITNPRSWLAVVGIALTIAAALTWGIWGSVPTRVDGSCIIMHRDGSIFAAEAYGAGYCLHPF